MKQPIHPDLLAKMDELGRVFPDFVAHRKALAELGSQIVFARFSKNPKFLDCGVALVRFSGAIESGFGLTRELLIFYTPHHDLQVRTYQAALAEMQTVDREITPDIIFVSAPDPRLRTKLDDWSSATPSLRAIPLSHEMDPNAITFIKLIRDYVYSRDLFYETTPVRGASFFGRKTLLQSLRDDVLSQRVAGVFGLRKAGKTSVLFELADQMRQQNVIPILLDLEAFPSPPEDPTPEILSDLRRRCLEELRDRKLRTKELAELSPSPTIVEFKTALQALLRRLEPEGVRLLIMLDEIEYLTPADKVDIAEGDMPRISQLLASLRSLVQEASNFTFMLSGLTSAIIESGRLYGRPNPLFSWAKAYYVGPFARDEADDLALSTGAKMGIEIEEKALEALFEASGGHAFLYRNFASNVVSALPLEVFRRIITRPLVLSRLMDWKAQVGGNISEMINHVTRYYSTESVLLDVLRELPAEFMQLAEDEPQALRHLLDLGLVRKVDHHYELNSLLDLL
ncbi:hypothetical protein [Lacisediminihabitans sp. H27-G8]|uniref:hypothetical protein n=1 Tax=Lacisediminihabitans sp. H27-G8 TaxID=3111909 RepID=UPI0038FC0813